MSAPATSRNLLVTDWSWVLSQASGRLRARGPALPVPAAAIPCAITVTGKHGTNGRLLNVRCRCQAGTRTVPRERFFGYDPIGEAATIAEAAVLWRAWHEQRGISV